MRLPESAPQIVGRKGQRVIPPDSLWNVENRSEIDDNPISASISDSLQGLVFGPPSAHLEPTTCQEEFNSFSRRAPSITQYYYLSGDTRVVKVALSSADSFVAPYIMEMLGDSLVEIPDDKLDDPASLDALLTPCNH